MLTADQMRGNVFAVAKILQEFEQEYEAYFAKNPADRKEAAEATERLFDIFDSIAQEIPILNHTKIMSS